MRTLRLSLVGTVLLALLGGLGGLALAQTDPGSDDLPPDVAPAMEWVTGTARCDMAQTGPTTSGDDWSRLRGWSISCWMESSDPRLRGELRNKPFGQDCTSDGCLSWGTVPVLGLDWSGWTINTEAADGASVGLIVLTGSGENEGYSAVITSVGQHGEVAPWSGFIYEGDPPPVP